MKNPFSKIPFLFLLIPLIVGILLQYYFKIEYISIVIISIGVLAMLFSYLIVERYQYRWRWLFGAGVTLCLISIGVVSTSFCQKQSEFTLSNQMLVYRGTVADTPKEKPRTTAYKVYLPDEDKYIVCYLQRDSIISERLQPGDEFFFCGKVQPFKKINDEIDFDYPRYMYNQGYIGSVYVSNRLWEFSGETSISFKYKALRYRQHILDFYQSLGFNDVEYGVLSALTLGYQGALSDDLKQGFRTTGTVHVLSVSGLHVGIIYLMISFLLGFIRKGTKYYWLKPSLIILLLWFYAFITGLPPSVVRASTMLTVFCVGEIVGRKSLSLQALYITAFFMLLINPFSLFDIGFQLSFMSVLSILYLHPKISSLVRVENRYFRYVWQMFVLSLVAQLATSPLCLYYFGTFPTYFFITNLLIVPLVTLITYSVGSILIAKLLSIMFSEWSYYFYYLPVKILQMLVHIMTSTIHFFENLPFATVDNIKISFIDMLLVFIVIISVIIFFVYKRVKVLLVGLLGILTLIVAHIYQNLN